MATRKAALTADGVVVTKRGFLFGITVTTLIGASGVNFYDNATTNTGTVLFSIPANAPVGSLYTFPQGIPFDNGVYADFLSTGGFTAWFE
jgi:hypothetical protein